MTFIQDKPALSRKGLDHGKKLCFLLLSLLLAAGTSACGAPAGEKAAAAGTSSVQATPAGGETSAAEKPDAGELPVINVVSDPLPGEGSRESGGPAPSDPLSGNRPQEPDAPAETAAPAPESSEAPGSAGKTDTFTITFAGDILMDPGYAAGSALTTRGAEGCFDEEALALMRGAQLFVVNNEFAWTARGTAVEKEFNFRADPQHIHILKDMGADLVTLGNNHTYDYGEEGLLDTLTALENAGIPYVGAGWNQALAERPAVYDIDGFRISIVNAESILFNQNPPAQSAQGEKPGTFDCYRPEMLFEAVRKAKAESDFCITVMHWGSEGKSVPNEKQLLLTDGAAEAGADLIIGGHPHVLQGISRRGDVPVCFSLGNYLFHSGTYDTGVIQAVFRPSERSLGTLRFVPMQCRNMKVCTLSGSEKERLLDYMRSLSPDVLIDGDGVITLP